MKVLVAHNRYASSVPSGENVVVDLEIDLLRAAGVDVLRYLPSSDQIPQLPLIGKATLPVSPVYAYPGVHDVAALLERERPDVLHLHNPYPLISPAVVGTAHRHGIPVVQTVHNFRHVCMKGTYFRDGHDCRDCLGKRFPHPGIQHGCYRGSRPQSVAMAVALAAHRKTWQSVDRYIALTPAIADHLRVAGISTAVTVKPNSVPDPGRHTQRGEGFLYVGRLAEEKGLPLLLAAWARHPVGSLGRLAIIGDGPLRGEVEAAATGRDDIDVVGSVEPLAVRAAMRSAAVVVLPSVWDEVCPMVAVEALANARPLLATAKGGLPYIVGRGGGWLVGPTVDGLSAGLARAHLEAGPQTAAAARRRYEETFAPDVVTSRLIEVYSGVAQRRRNVTGLPCSMPRVVSESDRESDT